MRTALLAGALLLAACTAEEAEKVATPLVPVALDRALLDTLPEDVSLVGRLVPIPGGGAVLTAPAAGVVRGLRVHVGQEVAAGELLLQLDVPELSANARQLEATAAVAEREAARQRALLADGVSAAKHADAANAAAVSARAAADAATRLLGRTRIASPLAGSVLRVLVREGERVESGATLAEVVSAASLDLMTPVPAVLLGRLRVGQDVTVRAEGDSTTHLATLTALGPGVDSLTNAGVAVIRVPNTRRLLRPGLSATASIRIGTRTNVLSIPDAALVVLGGQPSVFLVGRDSVAHSASVTPGVRHEGRIAIAADSVHAGDVVVTVGAAGLQDGMKVTTASAADAP